MWENDGQIELDIIIKINRALQVIKGSQRDYPNTRKPVLTPSCSWHFPPALSWHTLPVTTHSAPQLRKRPC